jgi:hypothetical protein
MKPSSTNQAVRRTRRAAYGTILQRLLRAPAAGVGQLRDIGLARTTLP